MTKRYISPQSGPVNIKTDKDSHYHSQEHTKPARRQNEASLSDLEDLKTKYVDMYVQTNYVDTYVHRQVPNYLPIMRLVAEAERKFDQCLRKVKAAAWEKGRKAYEAYGMSISGGNPGDELLRNPYESEEA